jgi:hypothetical protein
MVRKTNSAIPNIKKDISNIHGSVAAALDTTATGTGIDDAGLDTVAICNFVLTAVLPLWCSPLLFLAAAFFCYNCSAFARSTPVRFVCLCKVCFLELHATLASLIFFP